MQKKIYVSVSNDSTSKHGILVTACDTFYSKFLGLMFRKNLAENEGILLVQEKSNKIDSTIHMFFMNFNISVFWLDNKQRVVDKTIAKKWRPFYMPKDNAKFVLETHPNNFNKFNVGDCLSFEEF